MPPRAPSGRSQPPAGTKRRTVLAAVAGASALAAAALAAALLLGGPDRDPPPPRAGATISIDVPPGAAARLARGERLSVVPNRIVGWVGDTLRIVNRDRQVHTIGPFIVSPGQRLTVPLARAGVYVGTCSLHRSRKVEIVVRA